MKVAAAQILYKPCYYSGEIDFLVEPYGDNSTSISKLSFSGATKRFGKNRTEYISWLMAKINPFVKYSIDKAVDILVFPEYSIPAECLENIVTILSSSDMIIIAGTHIVSKSKVNVHDYPVSKTLYGSALCPVLSKAGLLGYTIKKNRSKWEHSLKVPEKHANSVIETPKGKIDIKICIDAITCDVPAIDASADLLIIPSYSPSTIPFTSVANLARYNEKPTIFVNISSLGGSNIYAAFAESDAHWLVEKGQSVPIPKDVECIVIATLDLNQMYTVKGTVKSHNATLIDSVVSIYYGRDASQMKLIDNINMFRKEPNSIACKNIQSLALDVITAKKIKRIAKMLQFGITEECELNSSHPWLGIQNIL